MMEMPDIQLLPPGCIQCYAGGRLAIFRGIFQYATPIEPSICVGGHPGGQVARPVAVVQLKDGLFEMVELAELRVVPWDKDDGRAWCHG